MRWFWLIFVIAFIGLGAVVFLMPPSGSSGAAVQTAPVGRQVNGAGDGRKDAALRPGEQQAVISAAATDGAKVVKPVDVEPVKAAPPVEAPAAETKPVQDKSGAVMPADAKSTEAKHGDAKPADGKPADAKPVEAKPAASGSDLIKELFPEQDAMLVHGPSAESGPGIVKDSKESTDAKPAAGDAEYVIPEHPVFKGDKSLKSKAVRRADGALVLDDKYVVKGKGTEAEPYLVPWELLISAQDVYKPRLGQTRLPQRVTMFDGAVVKLTGFVAFPVAAVSPREALMMLNQWDGCCIGTPPTPYDAVEVTLARPATGSVRLTTEGAVTGVLHVDPYSDNGWLLGLYLLEQATLKPGD